MDKSYPGEIWKDIVFNFEFTNDCRIQISNFGRIRTFNKIHDGRISYGSMINGYRIIRLKLYKPREEEIGKRFKYMQNQVARLAKKIKDLKAPVQPGKGNPAPSAAQKKELAETMQLLNSMKATLREKFEADLKRRVIYFQALVHRLVAEYFMTKPSAQHAVVAHLDFDKLNNRKNNLKWMTLEENYAHQQFSPYVIGHKAWEGGRRKEDSKATKLSVTKVMLLKKLLREGKPIRALVKQFKVTDTQILRIKRGENWTEVEAAP